MDLSVEVPRSELGAVVTNEMWDEIYDRIAELVRQHRSTLLIVNTRRLAERVAMHLAERLGEGAVAAHHGSLSRKLRLQAEKKLKNGEVAVLVATASLELGIDIGFVDLAVQIGSPRSISIALQRVGRSGHWRGAVPKARLFATTRDELLECAALLRAIRQSELDRIFMPQSPLDVLAQQIVAECASVSPASSEPSASSVSSESSALKAFIEEAATGYREDDLYALLTRAYPYRELPRSQFDTLIEMLSDGITARRGRYGAYLHRDRVHGRIRARRGARLAAITSGGAIPDNGLFSMVSMPDGLTVGTLDEDFAVESNAGDIILLGNTSWRIRRVEGTAGRVLVEDAHGAPPTVPFWRGEAPARTDELCSAISDLRQTISDLLPDAPAIAVRQPEPGPEAIAAIDWLQRECGLDRAGAEQAIDHVLMGRAVLGAVPTQSTVIAERFFDEGGGMQLVIHAPFGARVNKAWGLALRKRFCRSFNFELQAAATDDGINISLAEQHSFPLADVFHFLQADTVKDVLEQAVLTGVSPIFSTRWRWDAQRALALLRFQHGRKVPPQIQRIRSDDLLASVFPDVSACGENITGDIRPPDHPLVNEVMKDVLHEAMDLDGLVAVLRRIEHGEIRCMAVDTPVPSQFSHEILNANPYAYLDDAPLEERRARAVEMRRTLPESVLEEVGRLDPEAIAQVRQEAWPDVRDADELHDTLQTLIALPDTNAHSSPPMSALPEANWKTGDWQPLLEALQASRRAGIAEVATPVATPDEVVAQGSMRFRVAAERATTLRVLYPRLNWLQTPAELPAATPTRADAMFAIVSGWMLHSGPLTTRQLAETLFLPAGEVEQALLRMEASGSILRGRFTGAGETEWCERRLLARIHRLTLGRLRKEIEPATPAQFMNWLLRWQHVAPGTQVTGERGTLEVLRQLQGFEIPANAWERQVLAQRISSYDPSVLDQLCLTGAVGWGRLSPHPATLDTAQGTRRVTPTSVAPITFFVREEADWMAAIRGTASSVSVSSVVKAPPRDTTRQEATRDGTGRALSPVAAQVLDYLQQRGASFFADIVRGAFKLKSEVETALWELVAAGLVTADGFDNLRALIDPKRRAGQGRGHMFRPRHSTGRWSLLSAEPAEHTHIVESTCWMLLRRYGVVFRELLTRESLLLKWRELLMAFRRLEDRGEIRGGRFVSGFLGEQFALPVAVESLRAARKQPPTGEVITISAADPLNLIGIIIPGERVAAISGKYVSFRDGVTAEPLERHLIPARITAS
jgi:ATP-dependent Lhr-like helicase